MSKAQQLAPPRIIAVDVDGTLHIGGEPNAAAIELLEQKKAEGFKLMLWSMRGERHARAIATQCGCLDLFDVVTGKPGYVLDDEGWRWTRRTVVLRLGRPEEVF